MFQIGLISKTTWKAGDFLCGILGFLDVFGLYLSAFSVICISVDRYIVICHPFRIMEAVRRAKWMLWFAGIASFILSLPEVGMPSVVFFSVLLRAFVIISALSTAKNMERSLGFDFTVD